MDTKSAVVGLVIGALAVLAMGQAGGGRNDIGKYHTVVIDRDVFVIDVLGFEKSDHYIFDEKTHKLVKVSN